ncbi:MAG TPA: phosphatidate cytidylyltransferase [bacterium]|nr:phosphatidate cytidylyltransferase [bacterium]
MDSLPSPADRPAAEGMGPPAGGGIERPRPGGDRLATRLATAAIGMPLTLALVILGSPWLFVGVVGVILIGLDEFYRMVERTGYRPVRAAGMAAGVLFAVEAAWPSPWQSVGLPALLVWTVAVQLRRGRPDRALANTGLTLLGALYVGYLFSYVLRLRALGLGSTHLSDPAPALLVILVVWAADSAAYFVGAMTGRRKLLPQVSPNKSLEGAVGGIVAGILGGLVCGIWFRIPLPIAATVGGLCAAASIVGDLWESAVKREVGVKDAGRILPGHGGILDRFDGLLFAMAVGYFTMLWWPRG